MTKQEYIKNWQKQYVPFDVAELQEKIMLQAEQQGFTIPKAESLRILAKNFKSK